MDPGAVNLPPGFELDQQPSGGVNLPPGFELDQPEGMAESFGRGLLRNFPGAQQAVAAAAPLLSSVGLADEPTYGKELEHMTQAAQTDKAQNPWSYGAGAVTGTLGPMAIPGIGEAMGIAGPALDVAAGSGIVGGALNAAAQSLSDTNLTKPTLEDATKAGESAILGGGLGALGNMIGAPPTDEELAQKSAQGAGSIGNYSGEEAVGLPRQYAKELAANKLSPDLKGVQQLLGRNLNQELERTGQPIQAFDSVKTVLDKAQNAVDTLGEDQGHLIKDLDSNPAAQSQAEAMAHEAMGQFQQDARKWALPGQDNVPFNDLKPRPVFRTELAQAKRVNAELGILRDDPSFGAAQDLKEALSDKIKNFFKAAQPGQSQEPLMMGRTAIRNAMTDAAPPQLSDLLQRESKLYNVIEPIQRKAVGLMASGGRGAMMSYYTSPIALAAFGLGHVLGGWIPGMVAGVGTATAMQKYGPQIATAINRPGLASKLASNAMPSLSNAARLELANYLQSKLGKQ